MPQTHLTIEGTRTPSVQLATGARVTVLDTPEVRRRIAYGYVTVVSEMTVYSDDESGGGVQEPSTINVIEPPAKNASREDWSTFVQSLTVPTVEFDPDDPEIGRNDLIALYQEWLAQQPGDAPESE